MRRLAPRPLRSALGAFATTAAPPGLLAQVQAAWPGVAGARIAAEAEPVAERDGAVTVACSSALWAHELELLGADLLGRLNEHLGATAGAPQVRGMRFQTRDTARS